MHLKKQKFNSHTKQTRRKLNFEVSFAKETNATLWEDLNNYLTSIQFYEINNQKDILL